MPELCYGHGEVGLHCPECEFGIRLPLRPEPPGMPRGAAAAAREVIVASAMGRLWAADYAGHEPKPKVIRVWLPGEAGGAVMEL